MFGQSKQNKINNILKDSFFVLLSRKTNSTLYRDLGKAKIKTKLLLLIAFKLENNAVV